MQKRQGDIGINSALREKTQRVKILRFIKDTMRLSATPIYQRNVLPKKAAEIQAKLATKIKRTPLPRPVRFVAGCDASFSRDGRICYAGVAVFEVLKNASGNGKNFSLIETASANAPVEFPYIPGLLAFRELPPLMKAFKRLKNAPDLIICDGQGIAHPRRFGIASHLGLLLGTPSIGCAKSVLVGRYGKLPEKRGARVPLTDKGEIIGAALRTRTNVSPLIVSVGHKITLDEAIFWILALSPSYRITEPVRKAHALVGEIRKDETLGGKMYNEKE